MTWRRTASAKAGRNRLSPSPRPRRAAARTSAVPPDRPGRDVDDAAPRPRPGAAGPGRRWAARAGRVPDAGAGPCRGPLRQPERRAGRPVRRVGAGGGGDGGASGGPGPRGPRLPRRPRDATRPGSRTTGRSGPATRPRTDLLRDGVDQPALQQPVRRRTVASGVRHEARGPHHTEPPDEGRRRGGQPDDAPRCPAGEQGTAAPQRDTTVQGDAGAGRQSWSPPGRPVGHRRVRRRPRRPSRPRRGPPASSPRGSRSPRRTPRSPPR